jgi:hypothetical protein
MIGGFFINLLFVVFCFWCFMQTIILEWILLKMELTKATKFVIYVWASSLFIFPFFIYLQEKTLLSIAKEYPVQTDKSTGFIIVF